MVKLVVKMVFSLYEKDPKQAKNDEWNNIQKRLLTDPYLLLRLGNYDVSTCTKDMVTRAKKNRSKIATSANSEDNKQILNSINAKSKTCAGLFKWCEAIIAEYELLVQEKKMQANGEEPESPSKLRQARQSLKMNDFMRDIIAEKGENTNKGASAEIEATKQALEKARETRAFAQSLLDKDQGRKNELEVAGEALEKSKDTLKFAKSLLRKNEDNTIKSGVEKKDQEYQIRVDALWAKYDEDKSGVLEWNEAQKFLKESMTQSTGKVPSISQIKEVFNEIDENGDNVLDKNEVIRYLKGFELGSQLKSMLEGLNKSKSIV